MLPSPPRTTCRRFRTGAIEMDIKPLAVNVQRQDDCNRRPKALMDVLNVLVPPRKEASIQLQEVTSSQPTESISEPHRVEHIESPIHNDPLLNLCPYCDTPLVDNLSSTFAAMLASTKRISSPNPTSANPHGLDAPLVEYFLVCARHRLEMSLIPAAIQQGWPTSIDFRTLEARVCSDSTLRRLSAVMREPDQSVIWRNLKDTLGTSAIKAMSSDAQIGRAHLSIPGYYGHRGMSILLQILFNAFPPDEMLNTKFHPLKVYDFLELVMVSEVALILIMEDLGCDEPAALNILDDSREYGSQMFPALDVDEVGEGIAQKRAKRNRSKLAVTKGEDNTPKVKPPRPGPRKKAKLSS